MSSCDKTKKHVTQIELFDLAKEEMSEKDLRDLGGDKNELDSIANDILETDTLKTYELTTEAISDLSTGENFQVCIMDHSKTKMHILAI